jgi:hypothetical protein
MCRYRIQWFTTFLLSQLAVPDLRWEQTARNVGVDFDYLIVD